jgi:hypothetical protein
MKKILILGNSHVGCLKLALDDKRYEPEFEVFFIMKGGDHFLNEFQISENTIEPIGSFGYEVFNDQFGSKTPQHLDQFDKIIVFGLQLLVQGVGTDWKRRVLDLNKGYSSDVLYQSYVDSITSTLHYKILRLLSKHCKKVISVSSPLPSEDNEIFNPLTSDSKFTEPLLFKQIIRETIESLGFMHLSTPLELLNESKLATKLQFKGNSHSHLNAFGGELIWRSWEQYIIED